MSPRDILFECPACHKSLVVDEAAEGLIVDCPQCGINVIVPPKPAPTAPPSAKPAVDQRPTAPAAGEDLRSQLVTITSKLKELQTQRAEINNRLASRLNEINRDVVMVARLETSQQQVIAELNQLVGKIGTPVGRAVAGQTRVNLRS